MPSWPEWFSPAYAPKNPQRSLFLESLVPTLVDLGVSLDQASRWHQEGLLSFEPKPALELEQHEVWELCVLRDVYRSGFSDFDIHALTQRLPKPYQYDPRRLVYSFAYGWVLVDPPPVPEPSEVIEEHLEDWLESLEGESLLAWKRRILSKLESLEGESK